MSAIFVYLLVLVHLLEVADAVGDKRRLESKFVTGGSSDPSMFSKRARFDIAAMFEGLSFHTVAAGEGVEELLAFSMLNELKKRKTDVDAVNEDGDSPLILAAKLCRKDMHGTVLDVVVPEREPLLADLLLKHGSNPNQISSSISSQMSVLALAISNGCVKLVRRLLQSKELNLDEFVFENRDGDAILQFLSPIHLALHQFTTTIPSTSPLRKDLKSIAQALIEDQRVPVNGDAISSSLIFSAIQGAPADIVKSLLRRPDLDILRLEKVRRSNGKRVMMSPLQLSLEMNRLNIASAILRTLTTRNQLSLAINQFMENGFSPILILAKNCGENPKKSTHLAHMLLPMFDVNAVDVFMQTPLYSAVSNGCYDFVKLLLTANHIRVIGRDANGAKSILETALSTLLPDMKADHKRVSIALSLIGDARVNVNSIDSAVSRPPLHLAVEQAPLLVVQALLNRTDLLTHAKASSVLDPTGDVKQSALHVAAMLNRVDLINDLLRHIPVDILNSAGRTILCEVALHCNSRVCMNNLATILLNAGANPNALCSFERGVFPVLHALVDRRCPIVLKFLFTSHHLNALPVPCDFNARVQLRSPTNAHLHPLHLATGFSTDQARKLDSQNAFLVLRLLLGVEEMDVNARTSDGISPVQSWCESERAGRVIFRSEEHHAFARYDVLQAFWRRKDLDIEQRLLILDNCGQPITVCGREKYWYLHLEQGVQFGSEEFPKVYLKQVMDVIYSHIDGYMRDEDSGFDAPEACLPLLVVGSDLHSESETAHFLQQLTAAAFSFGAYENLSAENVRLDEYVRTIVTKEQDDGRLFCPAPASLELTPSDPMLPEVRERIRAIGALIGACLNTLLTSKSLVLGAPLDRVVLQSLIDPDAEIERSDAIESAVCTEAMELAKQGISLQEARQASPTHWPVLPDLMEVADGIVDEWENYCVALVDKLLESQLMTEMQLAFQATVHPEMESHHFSTELAYRMLVQRR